MFRKLLPRALCIVDRILISCFADCEVIVNKHRQLALTGYMNNGLDWQDQCGNLKTGFTVAKRPRHFLPPYPPPQLPGEAVRDFRPRKSRRH